MLLFSLYGDCNNADHIDNNDDNDNVNNSSYHFNSQ